MLVLDGIDDVSRFAFFSPSAPGTHAVLVLLFLNMFSHSFLTFCSFIALSKTRKIK